MSVATRILAGVKEWAVYLPLLVLFLVTLHFRVEGDTRILAMSADNARLCLAEARWPCDRYVVHFPVFQYLFAVPMTVAISDPDAVTKGLAFINAGFALLGIGIFARTGRLMGGVAGMHLALAVLFSGYAIFYFASSFNEIAAFALFAGFCLAVLTRRHWGLSMALAFLCCITKEVAAPFVLMVYIAARGARSGATGAAWWKDLLQGALPVIAGIAAGVIVNLVFNLFRFGEIGNVSNLHPNFRSPPSAVAAYFAYLFIAPAGGLLYVWFSLVALLAAALVASRKRDEDLVPMGWAILIVVGANIGLAFWWSSFGWNAWGPRLTLPFLGAAAVLVLWAGTGLLETLRRHPVTAGVLVFAVLFVSMLPNAMILLAPGRYFGPMFAPGTLDQLLGPDAMVFEKAGPELYKFALLESYGRPIVAWVTLRLATERPLFVATVALYAALAAWRIVCARASPRQG